MGTIRTLVLSGGGGRGAFHAGVYRYLTQIHKPEVSADHQGSWKPDIVVGTSIGAVNGAAIVQGIDADDLLSFWRSLRERDVEGLPPNMTHLSRWFVNQVIKNLIGVSLPRVGRSEATSLPPEKNWVTVPGLGRLGTLWLGRWANLLDTGPLRRTISERLGLDETRIAASPKTLLINATNVSTGQRVTFSNHPVHHRGTALHRPDVLPGITVQRILASCSIPLIYPWTFDEISQSMYWDGAVVANTPLGVSLDAANDWPSEDVMEVVVVLMTPWRDGQTVAPGNRPALPQDFSEAITWALDWALLASFRERLKMIEAFNRLADDEREQGKMPYKYRQVKVMIAAPKKFIDAARIIDYDEKESRELIEMGYQAAREIFENEFCT